MMRRNTGTKLSFAACGLLAAMLLAPGCARVTTPSDDGSADIRPTRAGLTERQRADNVASFDLTWETIRDNHYDANLNGVDWQAVRDELRPEVIDAESMAEARAVMQEMIGRLSESHYAIIPADSFESGLTEELLSDDPTTAPAGSGSSGLPGTVGFDIAIAGDAAIVTNVSDEVADRYPAVVPGAEIIAVNGKPLEPLLDRLYDETNGDLLGEFVRKMAVTDLLNGDRGSAVEVELESVDGQRDLVGIERTAPEGELVQFGNLPPFPMTVESRTFDSPEGPVVYITFNIFLAPPKLIPAIRDAVQNAVEQNAAGVIIDVRGNPGGLGALAGGIVGYFVDETGLKLGTMEQRGTTLDFNVNPRRPYYDGPLAVLIDGGSMSTSEIFAQGLADLDRARLFGTRTAGAALPSVIIDLPNGDKLQYAFADYVSDKGQRLEGNGVQPDVRVVPDRATYAAGKDPVIEAALQWITQVRAAEREENRRNGTRRRAA
ncbi:MAG: S41 family peptidase [Planctomycetota bacterium]